ncbi:unnamed protein product [Parnassius mnemosyne]|uniref:F-box domain-containing protein n=1 Tax=Parnassius mnemosyne TaxID=213953 RepID=A0AAV1M4M4_9NEOP
MELPFEVLIYLFKYLPKPDRKSASETCRSWYLAANAHCFLKNKVVVLYKSILSDEESSPLKIFENSPIIYSNYYFNEVEISNKLNEFWDRAGENIKCLTFKNCDICEKVFVYILQKCPTLESLNIESCKDLFMSGRLLEGRSDGLLVNNLDNLRSLSLSGNQYLTDALFSRFVKAAPVLQHLNFSGCSLQFHLGLVKKFYPSCTNIFENPSESVLTFYFVLQFIISHANYIKSLQFSNTLIDGAALKTLSEVENLKLNTLEVHFCDQLTNTGILALTTHQASLKELDIGLCSRVTDQSLVHICNNLVNLEYFNMQRCRAVTDLGIVELYKLKKLKSLNISQCELITNNGLEKGICAEENSTLEDLDLNSLNLDQTGVIMISEKLPNLRSLDLSYCVHAVTDTSIQVIFKNQILLHTLRISHCDEVSDAGLTGMGKLQTEVDDDAPIMSNYDEAQTHNKIHLGSRAEEEIVRDAKRKRDVMRMCEKLSMDSYTGYSLARLKGLRVLDISGCNRITDVSLTYAFTFKELVNLNLNDAVKEIVRGLRRLQQLELRGCNQLTDKTLEAVRSHCKGLKFLDVQGCRYISPELVCAIGSLPTLHTVLMSKPGPYITDGVKNRSPAPTFLPALMRKLRLH